MEEYISKSALVAEFKKRIRDYWSDSENTIGIYPYALEDAIKITETLEVKEVDLEKEINKYIDDEWCDEYSGDVGNWIRYRRGTRSMEVEDIKDIAKHFFELGFFSQLTWQDIRLISEIGEDFMNSKESDDLSEEEYYTAILNKLKEKGRDYKTKRQITSELEQKVE